MEYGLIGERLGHSYSPQIHAQLADYRYELRAMPPEELDGFLAARGFKGLNVTIPYKQQVMLYLDEISPEAQAIGAVNVVKIDDCRKLTGYNSDVIGFVNSIKPLLKPHHKKALILGTGGASKAIHYGLTKKLEIETMFVSRQSREGMITYEDITSSLLKEYEVIVNCTPSGMFPHIDECPALPYEAMNEAHLLYDLVYNPEETLFLKKGAIQGATVKNGLEMLHLQALASWDFWNN
jgi:shikimate dehydrogenase